MFLNNFRFSKRIKFYTTNLSLNYNIEGFVYLSREEQPVIINQWAKTFTIFRHTVVKETRFFHVQDSMKSLCWNQPHSSLVDRLATHTWLSEILSLSVIMIVSGKKTTLFTLQAWRRTDDQGWNRPRQVCHTLGYRLPRACRHCTFAEVLFLFRQGVQYSVAKALSPIVCIFARWLPSALCRGQILPLGEHVCWLKN